MTSSGCSPNIGSQIGSNLGSNIGRATSLGIDLGTSSVKALVIDGRGEPLAQASAEYPVLSAREGWAESETAAWWAAVGTAVREAVGRVSIEPTAIGLSGQMHGLVMVDVKGRALRSAMLWADSRAQEMLDAYRYLSGAAQARLANPLTPGMAGPLLMWVAQHEPVTYRQSRWALQPKDWLRLQLTGKASAEPSDASATLLYDVAGDCWDTATIADLGLRGDLLAELLPSGAALAGQLTSAAARHLGLRSGIPVAAGAADTAAAILGSGLTEPGVIQLTIGTGAQVVTPMTTPDTRRKSGIHLYRTATEHGWYALGATVSAGLALTWVRSILNADWAELYASAALPTRGEDPMFLPHLAGERTPYLDANLRGAWTNLGPTHDRASLLRAALEGVAFAIRDALDALPGADAAPTLRLAGGGTLAPAWRQLLADVLERPLFALDVPAASGRGAALLGAVAAGRVTVQEIESTLAPASRLVAEPQRAAVDVLRPRRAQFQHLIRAMRWPG